MGEEIEGVTPCTQVLNGLFPYSEAQSLASGSPWEEIKRGCARETASSYGTNT